LILHGVRRARGTKMEWAIYWRGVEKKADRAKAGPRSISKSEPLKVTS